MRSPFTGLTVSDCKEVVTNVTVQCNLELFWRVLRYNFLTSQCQDDVSGVGLSAGQDGGLHEQHGELGGGDDGGLLQREKEN